MPTELSYESEAGHTLTEEGYEYGVTIRSPSSLRLV